MRSNKSISSFQVLDWDYYIERLGGTIQKIITIPAALQQVANPVPRVHHPDWLHKKLLEKNDIFKQKRISEMFTTSVRSVKGVLPPGPPQDNSRPSTSVPDMEDFGVPQHSKVTPISITTKRKRSKTDDNFTDAEMTMSWREVLGPPPPLGETKVPKTSPHWKCK
jgi:DNA polymerase epsilon subunit 1